MALRTCGAVVTAALLLVACGPTTSSTSGSEGTPTPRSTDVAAGTAAASGSSDAAEVGTAAPEDRSAVTGGEPGVAPGGDGSAVAALPVALDLPIGWRPVPPDGPHARTTVCGVDLDPVRPADAAQRRWVFGEAQYLEAEAHVFSGTEGGTAAETAVDTVRTCAGYGLRADGAETSLGDGEYNVEIDVVTEAPAGWTVWSETTIETGMVRHIALAPDDSGWLWMSHVDVLGTADAELLLSVLPEAGLSGTSDG